MTEAADKMVTAALYALDEGMQFAYDQGLHEFGYDPVKVVTEALQSSRPAGGEAEPVAWMYIDKHGCKRVWLTRQSLGYVQAEQEVPLYAHPAPSPVSADMVEKLAEAVYAAEDTQSGDTIGTVIWNSDHLFYDTVEGESIVDRAKRASMPTCRDAVRAVLDTLQHKEAGHG